MKRRNNNNNRQQSSGNFSDFEGQNVPVVRNVFFKRVRGCPLSDEGSPKIDYRDVEMLLKFVSERGRIMPSRITSVSAKMQRRLARAIKRARILALMPFVVQ